MIEAEQDVKFKNYLIRTVSNAKLIPPLTRAELMKIELDVDQELVAKEFMKQWAR